jgi:hypothetical protein
MKATSNPTSDVSRLVENNLPATTSVGAGVTTELREFLILAAYLYVRMSARRQLTLSGLVMAKM